MDWRKIILLQYGVWYNTALYATRWHLEPWITENTSSHKIRSLEIVSVSELYPFEVSEWLEGMGGNKGSKLVQKVEKMNLNGGEGDQTDGCFPR